MERELSVDILKGIGILLVLIGHTTIPHEVSLWIYGFHMPLFFCASGFFAKDLGFWCSMQKNCRSILIPWLFMFLCFSFMNIFVSILHSGDVWGSFLSLKGKYNLLDEDSLWYPTIWFLVCLFMLKTIDSLVCCVIKRTNTKLVMGGVIYGMSNCIQLPFFIDTAMAMFLFYEIGYIFHINGWYQKRYHWSIPLAILVLYTAFVHIVLPAVDTKHNDFPFYLPFMALPMIWALYQFCKMIESNVASVIKSQLSHFGRSSLVLFGLSCFPCLLVFRTHGYSPYSWLYQQYLYYYIQKK